MSKYWWGGYMAYPKLESWQNPYPLSTEEYRDWEEGWFAKLYELYGKRFGKKIIHVTH